LSRRDAARRRDAGVVAAISLLLVAGFLLALSRRGSVSQTALPDTSGSDGYDLAAPQGHRPGPDTLAVGVTHTQYSIDDWGNGEASASARAVLTATATYQNQHIFGWGALNPEPRPGVFDWSSLDRRVQLIRSTGGTPVITLCCAPDWMKGGQPGQTDWKRIEDAPTPNHYSDFAALAVSVARRYPDVRHFQVWNELKGFWDKRLQRWDYEAYTDFYNVVYDALKAIDQGIAVGGPYVVVDVWRDPAAGGHPSRLTGECGTVDQRSLDVVEYWLEHKHGADFVSVDASSGTRDDGMVTSNTTSVSIFDGITRWLRQRTSLPVWWSEFHVGSADSSGQRQLVALATAALLHMADAGASAALVWQPQGDAPAQGARPPALWTSTARAGGGRPLAYAEAVARLQQVLADRASADPVSWPQPEVGLVRGRQALLLVHTEDGQADVDLAGRRLRLAPYEVRYVQLRPRSPAGPALPDAPPTSPRQAAAASRCLRPMLVPHQFDAAPRHVLH
jgi:hypothetical protein